MLIATSHPGSQVRSKAAMASPAAGIAVSDLDVEDVNNLRQRGKQARLLVLNTPFPTEIKTRSPRLKSAIAKSAFVVKHPATILNLPSF
jgi:phosphoenolpyruvate synthase/pyruvate phosphate dikinase